MADYDWFDPTPEQIEKDRQDHLARVRTTDWVNKMKGEGFIPFTKFGKRPPEAWKCLRGCGTVVWDIDAHKRNVCPTKP
jgi:hypothetical protein